MNLEMRSSWTTWVGLKSNDMYPYKKKACGDLKHTQRRQWEDGSRVTIVKQPQGMPTATRTWQRQAQIGPWSRQRKGSPANTLTAYFWPTEV